MVVGWAVSAAALLLGAGRAPQISQEDIVRVRALIVLDEEGRERIVLGAPIPDLRSGTRESVANGMVILGENGRDRVVVGTPVPDPRIQGRMAKRIAPASGIQINGPEGNERARFGYLDNGRVVFGLDYENGEAVTLAVRPDGSAGVRVNGRNRRPRAFLGTTALDTMTRLVLFDTAGTERVRIDVKPDTPTPSLTLLDQSGRPTLELPGSK
jgi:hypothetical protein